MTITDRLNEIEARANAATKGPWRSRTNHAPYKCVWISKRENYSTLELLPEDADFVANARTDVPSLCAAVRRAVEALQNLTSYESHKCELPEYSEGVDWGRAVAAHGTP